jgi:hypothetical protein
MFEVAQKQPVIPPNYVGDLARDEASGKLIGIEPLPVAPHPDVGAEYPRWITPHVSHVHVIHHGPVPDDAEKIELKTIDGNLIVPPGTVVSVPGYEYHIRRTDNALTVLVTDEEDEKRALAEYTEPEPLAYVSPAERQAAEKIYDSEKNDHEDDGREQRIAEIINEQRQRAIDQAEQALEAQRQRLVAIPVRPAPHVVDTGPAAVDAHGMPTAEALAEQARIDNERAAAERDRPKSR